MAFKIIGTFSDPSADVYNGVQFMDAQGTMWNQWQDERGRNHLEFGDKDGWHEEGPGTDYPDREPMDFISQAQEKSSPYEVQERPSDDIDVMTPRPYKYRPPDDWDTDVI